MRCPQCGGSLIQGQPVCTDCGRPTGDDSSTPGRTPRGEATPGSPRGLKRDKSKDHALVGQTIAGKYRVLEVLGQGGFGTVYLVEITAGMVGEKLALKILPEDLSHQPAFRNQFLNEIRLAMRVVDRYIVQIRDVGVTEEGLLYYTMDYSAGLTLAEVIRREGRIAVTRTLLIVLNVLRALQTAHAAGIIHRDLKPANIMVESQGGKESVRVVDFGIAMAVQADAETTKGFAGSPYYMPPEQFMGEEIGFYTDLYSVGVILYESLTGRRPYPGSTPQEVFKALKAGPPPAPDTLNPEIAEYPGLSEMVLKSLERNPERRYQSAKELFEAANAILVRGTAVEEEPAPRGGPAGNAAARAPQARVRRRRRVARRSDSRAGWFALGVLVIGGGAAALIFRDEIPALLSPPPAASTSKGPDATAPEVAGEATAKAAPVSRGTASPSPAPPRAQAPAGDVEPSVEARQKEAAAELTARASKFLEEGRKALEKGEWREANERADTVLGFQPDSTEARRLKGVAALRSGDFKAADISLEMARSGAPDAKADSSLLLALAEAKLGLTPPRPGDAEDLLRAVLRETPKDPAAILLLARALEQGGKEESLKKLIGAAKKGKVASAEIDAFWERLFVVEPRKRAEEAGRLSVKAREALAQGDHRKAAEIAAEWNRILPSDEAALLAAESLLELGETAKAQAIIQKALQAALEAASTEGDPPDGDGAARVSRDPARLEALLEVCKGRALLAQAGAKDEARRLTDAEAAFTAALTALARTDPKESKRCQGLARLGLARVHGARGAMDEVLEALKPLQNETAADLGMEEVRVLLAAGRRAEAKAMKIKAFQLGKKRLASVQRQRIPEDLRRESHYLLGLLNTELGDWEGNERGYRTAVENFAAASQAGLKTVELYESWSFAYDRLGNLLKAAQVFRNIYDIEPTPENCLRAAEQFLKVNPRSPDAIAILKQGTERFKGNDDLMRKYLELNR